MQRRAAPPRRLLRFRAPSEAAVQGAARSAMGVGPTCYESFAPWPCRRVELLLSPGLAEAEENRGASRRAVCFDPGSPLLATPRSPRFFLSKRSSGMEALESTQAGVNLDSKQLSGDATVNRRREHALMYLARSWTASCR